LVYLNDQSLLGSYAVISANDKAAHSAMLRFIGVIQIEAEVETN
jgi:hypothetical protein